MKILRYIIMTFAMVTALSAVSFAQKDDKKPPPKPPPPVIKPGEKPKEDKPKKPGEAMAFWKKDSSETV